MMPISNRGGPGLDECYPANGQLVSESTIHEYKMCEENLGGADSSVSAAEDQARDGAEVTFVDAAGRSSSVPSPPVLLGGSLHHLLLENCTKIADGWNPISHPLASQTGMMVCLDTRRVVDAVLVAPTGTGKTCAFLLVMSHHLLSNSERVLATSQPSALIIVPNRELALQVAGVARCLIAGSGIEVVVLIGGEKTRFNSQIVYKNKHLVIGTPGRIHDHISSDELSLANVSFLVFDEVDRLARAEFSAPIAVSFAANPKTLTPLLPLAPKQSP